MTAVGVLNRYQFKTLRPGENDEGFEFDGPGLVVICRDEPVGAGENSFSIVTAVSATNDALTIAKRMLAQRAGGEKYAFAMLSPIQKEGERQAALLELAPRCSEGI